LSLEFVCIGSFEFIYGHEYSVKLFVRNETIG
jgi:hypothetical protein